MQRMYEQHESAANSYGNSKQLAATEETLDKYWQRLDEDPFDDHFADPFLHSPTPIYSQPTTTPTPVVPMTSSSAQWNGVFNGVDFTDLSTKKKEAKKTVTKTKLTTTITKVTDSQSTQKESHSIPPLIVAQSGPTCQVPCQTTTTSSYSSSKPTFSNANIQWLECSSILESSSTDQSIAGPSGVNQLVDNQILNETDSWNKKPMQDFFTHFDPDTFGDDSD